MVSWKLLLLHLMGNLHNVYFTVSLTCHDLDNYTEYSVHQDVVRYKFHN